jgi:hypothetical protein
LTAASDRGSRRSTSPSSTSTARACRGTESGWYGVYIQRSACGFSLPVSVLFRRRRCTTISLSPQVLGGGESPHVLQFAHVREVWRREIMEGSELRPPPVLFGLECERWWRSYSVAPLRSAFSGSGLLYRSCWRQRNMHWIRMWGLSDEEVCLFVLYVQWCGGFAARVSRGSLWTRSFFKW